MIRMIYQNPDENPPGGTRGFESPCVFAGAGADDFTSAADGALSTGVGAAAVSIGGGAVTTFSLASILPTQWDRFDEFCWLYLGRALMGHASGSPKMLEWPPPGGFRTRLELFSPIPEYKFVVVILALFFLSCGCFNRRFHGCLKRNSSGPSAESAKEYKWGALTQVGGWFTEKSCGSILGGKRFSLLTRLCQIEYRWAPGQWISISESPFFGSELLITPGNAYKNASYIADNCPSL